MPPAGLSGCLISVLRLVVVTLKPAVNDSVLNSVIRNDHKVAYHTKKGACGIPRLALSLSRQTPSQSYVIKNATDIAFSFYPKKFELVTTALQLELRCCNINRVRQVGSTTHYLRLGNIFTCETMATSTRRTSRAAAAHPTRRTLAAHHWRGMHRCKVCSSQ